VLVLWGLAFGAVQAASPLAPRWLDQATVWSSSLQAHYVHPPQPHEPGSAPDQTGGFRTDLSAVKLTVGKARAVAKGASLRPEGMPASASASANSPSP
jgi:hypothetical protein